MTEPRRPEVVAITGASAGVGRATAIAFAREGARLGLIARGVEGLDATCEDVRAAGGEALALSADVSDPIAIEQAATAIEEAFGPIDVWVNNAMVSVFAPVAEMTAEDYRRVTEVTYLGCVHGTLSALQRMRARDAGVIIQVGSALAYRSIPLQSAYCAAKHAVRGFTESLRTELLHEGSRVHVTSVHLPAMNTPQFEWSKNKMPFRPQPVPPIFQPEVAAEAILWSARHRRRDLWVGIPTIRAIVGEQIAPGLLDWYLAKTGYASQQTDIPRDPDLPDNLWHPVPGDRGAHGAFDDQARNFSPQLWATTHRPRLAAAGAITVALAGLALRRTRSTPRTFA